MLRFAAIAVQEVGEELRFLDGFAEAGEVVGGS
jgi:hypothetical protein